MTLLTERLPPVIAAALRSVTGARAPGAEPIATALGECLRLLAERSPDGGAVALQLASASVRASALIGAGVLPIEVATPLALARNLVLEGSSSRTSPRIASSAPGTKDVFFVAARQTPQLRELQRAPLTNTDGAEPIQPPANASAIAETSAAEEQDDDEWAHLVDVSPPHLEWLEAEADPYVPPQPLPAIRLGEGGDPRPLSEFYAGVVGAALEVSAMLARHNAERPIGERRESEERILALTDAAMAAGADCAQHCQSWWQASLESPDPWKSWAPAFVLGCLAGDDTLAAIQRRLEALGDKPVGAGRVVAEALTVAPHSDVPTIVRELLVSSRPVARAAGIELGTLRTLLSAEDVVPHLCDTNAIVLSAALRAASRVSDGAKLTPYVLPLMHYPDRGIAWEATRALALWGRPEPYRDIAARGKLTTVLGPLALEALVLYGEERDLTLVEAIVKKLDPTPSVLSVIARFGHPLSWAFLVHFLGDEDLGDAASRALVTIFGPLVSKDAKVQKSPAAWRDAIGRARLDPQIRYSAGEPWAADRVIEECRRGRLTRYEVERRRDEVNVRVGANHRVDLESWSSVYEPQLASFAAAISDRQRGRSAGSWVCAARG